MVSDIEVMVGDMVSPGEGEIFITSRNSIVKVIVYAVGINAHSSKFFDKPGKNGVAGR
jgi:hypothetical protein